MTRGRRLALALLMSLAIGSLLAACGRGPSGPPARPTPDVTTVTVVPRDIPVTFEFVAQTQSSQSVNIQARVSGFLDRRVYTEGAVVKAGQVLFLMDPKPLQAQVDAAQAALNNAQASLEVAKFDLDRTKPLAEQNALSQKDLDDANGQYLSSKANVDQARANLESAKLNLSYATITSPITGVTGSAVVADGTYVSASNSQLTTVSVLSPMWVTFSLSEAEALQYRDEVDRGLLKRPPGDQYAVEVVMADGSIFPEIGHITFTDPAYNSQTGTFTVRVQLTNPQGRMRPNQFVRARVKGAVRPNALVVPQRAVQQGPKGHFVWVVDKDSKVEMRPVGVGSWIGDDWQITQGLEPDSVVVVDGALSLTSGAVVKPRPLPAATPAKGTAAVASKTDAKAPPHSVANNALPASVYFARGSAALTPNANAALRAIGNALIGVPYVVEITGYADANGQAAKNRALAEQRAEAVRDALMAAGVKADLVRVANPADVIGGTDPERARRVDIAFVVR
jgi:membrane fusion protein (multidrug efflux system)